MSHQLFAGVGPCEPIGRHRSFHKLYAVATDLAALAAPTRARVEAATRGPVLDKAELIGTYQKKGSQAAADAGQERVGG